MAAGSLTGVGVVLVRRYLRNRIPPEERERRRRASINATGKMGDANLLEITDNTLLYSYEVRGVTYTAAQDVSHLHDLVVADLSGAIGPVYVKYNPKNPANSIILSEDWSGLRIRSNQP